MTTVRPIGFWLKLVDRLIDDGFARTLEEHGVTRRQWQLLNVLSRQRATVEQLDHIATLLPAEWLAASATGSPAACAAEVVRQFSLGVSGVILHGATPGELAPVVEAYRAVRPALPPYPANPGRVA